MVGNHEVATPPSVKLSPESAGQYPQTAMVLLFCGGKGQISDRPDLRCVEFRIELTTSFALGSKPL